MAIHGTGFLSCKTVMRIGWIILILALTFIGGPFYWYWAHGPFFFRGNWAVFIINHRDGLGCALPFTYVVDCRGDAGLSALMRTGVSWPVANPFGNMFGFVQKHFVCHAGGCYDGYGDRFLAMPHSILALAACIGGDLLIIWINGRKQIPPRGKKSRKQGVCW